MYITLTFSPDTIPITDLQMAALPITPDHHSRQSVSYVGEIAGGTDPMRFLCEFVHLKGAIEAVLGPYLAYVEVDGGDCYLDALALRDLADLNVMLGINIQEEDDPPFEAPPSQDRDHGDVLRRQDDLRQPPEG